MKVLVLFLVLLQALSHRHGELQKALSKSQLEFKSRRQGIKVSFRFKSQDQEESLKRILEQQNKVEAQLEMRLKQKEGPANLK